MDVPIDWRVTLLANAPNPKGILRSRAIGEPPLLMGCSVFFAIRNAIATLPIQGRFQFDSPATVTNIVNTLAKAGAYTQKHLQLQ
jgi:xanthine dehydrogenase/oxidase